MPEPSEQPTSGQVPFPHSGAALQSYAPPRVVRVRVATARLVGGQVDANNFCTVHDHDAGFGNCTIGS